MHILYTFMMRLDYLKENGSILVYLMLKHVINIWTSLTFVILSKMLW